jgi:DNA invertase Pin-like site-specific DNA recombinase
MASLAEMERELTVERLPAGLEVARQLGRKRQMTDSKSSRQKTSGQRYPASGQDKNLGVSISML